MVIAIILLWNTITMKIRQWIHRWRKKEFNKPMLWQSIWVKSILIKSTAVIWIGRAYCKNFSISSKNWYYRYKSFSWNRYGINTYKALDWISWYFWKMEIAYGGYCLSGWWKCSGCLNRCSNIVDEIRNMNYERVAIIMK